MTLLEDTFDKLLSRAHKKNLALGLFLGVVESSIAMHDEGVLSDAGCIDTIKIAMQRAAAAVDGLKGEL